MHTGLRLGAIGTNVVPLLTVGVGAAMVVGAAPSKPNEAKGKTQTSYTEQKYAAVEAFVKTYLLYTAGAAC